MDNQTASVYLGLGTNLGDREANLRQAIQRLEQIDGIELQEISDLYETSPVGYLDQPPFYNMVIRSTTTLSPRSLLEQVLQVENQLRRVRTIRFGPRSIDIDILLYEDRLVNEEDLQIPHPRMVERGFVLVPLFEIAGDLLIPGTNKTITQWIKQLPPTQTVKQLNKRIFSISPIDLKTE
jgi:2-amino-4-hydroxy-6-hydroxymethyldihydropteridine diphosphokinase